MSKKAKSELDEKDLKVMKELEKAHQNVSEMLKEHKDVKDIAEAYEAMRKLMAPNFVKRLIGARRLEIEGKLDAGSPESK